MTLCCSSSSSSSYRRAGAVALGWSLFAFNLGVEIGQACIVGAVAPLLAMVRERAPRLGRQIVTGGSVAVALAGGYWFFERVLALRGEGMIR